MFPAAEKVVIVSRVGGATESSAALLLSFAMAAALARKAADYVRSKDFRDYLMR